MTTNPFIVDVGSFRKSPGESRHEKRVGHLKGIRVSESYVPDDSEVSADVRITAAIGGMEVKGGVVASWVSQCRRCLNEINGKAEAQVDELFTNEPDDGETYNLDDNQLDLEPMVRDAVVLSLPIAPLCRDDCKGLCPNCGANWNDDTCDCERDLTDERWSVLDQLKDNAN